MFLDSAKIVSLTLLLRRQLKLEPSSRYTWSLYWFLLLNFLYYRTNLAVFPNRVLSHQFMPYMQAVWV